MGGVSHVVERRPALVRLEADLSLVHPMAVTIEEIIPRVEGLGVRASVHDLNHV